VAACPNLSDEDLRHEPPTASPFSAVTAAEKVRIAKDAWNTRDPARVVLGHRRDRRWRNCAEFIQGWEAIEAS